MGDFRWLTVGPVGQPDVAFVLMAIPGPSVFDAETAAQLEGLMAKGATGAYFFSTDDCRATYKELLSRRHCRSATASCTPETPARDFATASGSPARTTR